MTVTDEDRKAAGEYLEAIIPTWPNLGARVSENGTALARAFAAHRQAAYAAGLERAAVILEEDAKLCDCFARAEGECACGAWDDYKTAPIERMVDLIRAEKDKT